MMISNILSQLTTWIFFFFNDTATTEIYTLSLHDALPISFAACCLCVRRWLRADCGAAVALRSEEHTSELQSQSNLVCRLLLEKKMTLFEDEQSRHAIHQLHRLAMDALREHQYVTMERVLE